MKPGWERGSRGQGEQDERTAEEERARTEDHDDAEF